MSLNSAVNFFIFTDIKDVYEYGYNVRFIKISLDQIKDRACMTFQMKCQIGIPYKWYDYKLVFGIIIRIIYRGMIFLGGL